MTELKKISYKVFVLLFDIILLNIGVIKDIVLPNRKRKGNLLNSLFVFFVGTVEILDHFEYGIFQMTKIFRHRYIRQGVIIISAFLFLLSSFEWSSEKEINRTFLNANVTQLPQKVLKSIPFNKAKRATNSLEKTSLALNHSVNIYRLPGNFLDSTPVKRYLFIRSILI
jgi:hypothetical protein